MKRCFWLFLLLLLIQAKGISLYAIDLKGKVVDDQGEAIVGASLVEQGTTNGTTTDIDGNFTLKTKSEQGILVVSYLGYQTQHVKMAPIVNIILKEDSQILGDVVVTALGIKREAKALGYAVSNVAAESLQSFSKTNPLEALSGQVSGLNISSSGSGAGGSNKITIRGISSLTGSNDPLYVVDGVPMDNSGGASGGQYGGTDYGNAANNINPDDIESISVLKGGAAAALYGSRGQNGVIMITTRKGAKNEQGLGIKYSYQMQSSTPTITPEFQNLYSQGSAGKFFPTDFQSWGVKMNNQEVTNFLGQKQKLGGVNDSYNDYFRTGYTHNNSISFDKRSETIGAYVSYTNTADQGIVPGNKLDKNSITVRVDATLGEFLSVDAKVNYIEQKGYNRPNLGGSPDNPVYSMFYMPRSVGLDMLETYKTNAGLPIIWTEQYTTSTTGNIIAPPSISFAKAPLLSNPFWSENLNTNQDTRKRLIGFAELKLDLKKMLNLGFDLSLKGRAGIDQYSDDRLRLTATNTYYKANGLATISQSMSDFAEKNFDFLLNASHRLGKLGMSGSFGGNLMLRGSRSMISSSESGTINKEGAYVVQNFYNVLPSQGISDSEVQSIYGFATLDWDNQVYLDVTARNDWTSTLSAANRSIFYPSVSSSWIISETFELPKVISLLKVRASWASVGSGGNYSTYRYNLYGTNPNQFHGLPYGFIPDKRVNPNLKSEYTISKEVGASIMMFLNRLSADFSLYQSGTKNQIFSAPLAPSSGNSEGIINAGYIANSGVETQIRGSIIKNKNFEWWAGVNYTYQWNEVKELPENVPVLTLGGINGVTINAKNGIPVGSIQGTSFARDNDGNLILDKDNLPTIKQNDSGSNDINVILGKIYPDYLVGFNTGFNYKGLTFTVLIDGKLGYNIYSYSNAVGSTLGTLQSTIEGRDEWESAKKIYGETGVLPNMGYLVEGVKNGAKGVYAADPQQYWMRVADIAENWVYDASFIRVRQINLAYTLKPQIHKIKFLGDIGLNAGVNNLFYIMKKTPNISPESISSTGNAAGYEAFAMPETMLFTFGVNLSF